MKKDIKIEIKLYRKKYYIYAGVSRLFGPYKTEAAAQKYYDDNKSIVKYWADSASVSIENTKPVIKHI